MKCPWCLGKVSIAGRCYTNVKARQRPSVIARTECCGRAVMLLATTSYSVLRALPQVEEDGWGEKCKTDPVCLNAKCIECEYGRCINIHLCEFQITKLQKKGG